MYLVDYIIVFVISTSFFFGFLRGFYKEITSLFFWIFNFYFFNNYYYFTDFYFQNLENIFLHNNILIGIMIAFFLFIKIILNYFFKTIFQKIKLSYFNIILGGIFGLFRGLLLVFFILFILYNFNYFYYNFYIKHSILIFNFFQVMYYFLIIFDSFFKN